MKSKLKKRFYGAAILYLIIAVFFLLLHFFQLKRFSGIRGNISFIGLQTEESGLSPAMVRKIKVFYNGLEINLGTLQRLKAVTSDGIVHPLKFQSYTLLDDGILLHFDNDVNLRILSDLHSKKVTLTPELPLTIPPMQRLWIPVQWMENFGLSYDEDLYLLSKNTDEETYYVTVPSETILDEESSIIDLDVSNNILRDVVLEETLTGTGRTLDDWYEKEGGRAVEAGFDREINDYQNLVFQSLKGRLNGNGSFTDVEGDSYYSEEAINSLMIEAIDRNLYPGIQGEQAANSVRNRSRLSYISAPYLGDIVTHGSNMISSDWRLYSQMKEGLDNEDFPFFDYPDVYLFFQTQQGLYREMEKLDNIARTQKGNLEDFSYQILRLRCLLQMERAATEAERFNLILADLQQLLQNTFWIKEDLLLFDQQGIAQMEASLQLGMLLIDFSDILDNEKLLAAGRKTVLSALKYRDDLGYLPQELILNSSGEAEREGFLPPERVYSLVNHSQYQARRIDLSGQLGPGKWVYTGVSKFTLSSTPRETRITMDFPVDNAHHLIIRGIKPFTQIYLHGIRWKSDQNFQRYSDGWLYDENREILYLKLQHRIKTETVRILYYENEVTQSSAPIEP